VPWFRWDGADLVLQLAIQPRARETAFAGAAGDRLKVRLTAPPVEGRANEALVDFLSAEFGVPKRQILLEQGETGRQKRVRVVSPRKIPKIPDLHP
jgi:uncharacterized protein